LNKLYEVFIYARVAAAAVVRELAAILITTLTENLRLELFLICS